MTLDSSINQSVFILVISSIVAIGYNTIRSDSLDLIYIKPEGAGVSKLDSLLATETILVEPVMIDRELAKKMGIKIENLNNRQIADLYYWSKYILNNELNYLF